MHTHSAAWQAAAAAIGTPYTLFPAASDGRNEAIATAPSASAANPAGLAGKYLRRSASNSHSIPPSAPNPKKAHASASVGKSPVTHRNGAKKSATGVSPQ